jgi:pilus assembly protein FimV
MTQRLLATLWLMLLAHSALAVGLGDLVLQSALGQPLKAEIPLIEAQEWSAEQIRMKLSGVSESSARAVRLSLVQSGNARVIQLTTREPVNEPYVGFTLKLSWPDGSIKRDYQLLLDPPGSD